MQDDDWLSVSEAAKEARVVRQAIFNAIKKGQIPSKIVHRCNEKRTKTRTFFVNQNLMCVRRRDLDKYRQEKNLIEKRQFEGRSLFDLSEDRWSVIHASKWFADEMGRFYPPNRLYHLIRKGELPAKKHGKCWVLSKKDLVDLYLKENEAFEEEQKKWRA